MPDSEKAPVRGPILVRNRVAVDPEVLSESIGEEMVLVHLGSDCIYELNTTASLVWSLVRDGCSRDEIVRRLLADYDIDEARLDWELDNFISELRSDGLVKDS